MQLALAALGASLLFASASPAATQATTAALPPEATAGFGADLPFVEYEAENGVTNGEVIGPDRRFTTLAAEASGRRAVRLEGLGRFVEFTLARPANALTVRLSIPDSADGAGIDATLGVYADGARIGAIAATSRFSHFYGAYPFTNRPADGNPHHYFNEPRLLLGRVLPAGTKVQLRIGEGDDAPFYAVDLADFEMVPPPLVRPRLSLSLLDFGADPKGGRDAATAFRKAVAAARRTNRILWIPPGRFRVNGHVIVDRVTIAGAGAWYSILNGDRIGFYGRPAPKGSTRVVLRDFAIFGEVKARIDHDQVNGIGGAMGGGSLIENLWIQHVKVGLWFDGPMDGVIVRGLRILDTTADGLNFHRGVSHALVENVFIRNTGDDGLAAWSGKEADHHIVFRRNTIVAPILANGIALYGGHDLVVSGNLVADTLTEGGGIHLGNRFDAVPLSGAIDIADNVILRGGSFDPRWRFGVGALWLYALDAPIDARISVRGMRIADSSEEGVLLLGKAISGLSVENMTIANGGSHAIVLRSPGSLELRDVAASGPRGEGVLECSPGVEIRDRGGNSGLQARSGSGCEPRRR